MKESLQFKRKIIEYVQTINEQLYDATFEVIAEYDIICLTDIQSINWPLRSGRRHFFSCLQIYSRELAKVYNDFIIPNLIKTVVCALQDEITKPE